MDLSYPDNLCDKEKRGEGGGEGDGPFLQGGSYELSITEEEEVEWHRTNKKMNQF